MAIIKSLGSIISSITGSIDKCTYVDGKQGQIIKKKLEREDAKSTDQQIQRDAFKFTCNVWGAISNAMRDSWANLPAGANYTAFNAMQKSCCANIGTDIETEISNYNGESTPSNISVHRYEFSDLVYIDYNNDDVLGSNTLQLFIWPVGGVLSDKEILRYEIDSSSDNPLCVAGLESAKDYLWQCAKHNNNYNLSDRCSESIGDILTGSEMSVPIGAIIPWTNHITGTPALPPQYWLCDGSEITDPDSPMCGQYTDDLNGTGRYLKGDDDSGLLESGEVKAHSHGKGTLNIISSGNHAHNAGPNAPLMYDGTGPYTLPSGAGWRDKSITVSYEKHVHGSSDFSGDTSSYGTGANDCDNMHVIWVIRIK